MALKAGMGCFATSLRDEEDCSVVAVIVGDKDVVDNSGVERQSAVLPQAVTTALYRRVAGVDPDSTCL